LWLLFAFVMRQTREVQSLDGVQKLGAGAQGIIVVGGVVVVVVLASRRSIVKRGCDCLVIKFE
jgi:hypothetical protein